MKREAFLDKWTDALHSSDARAMREDLDALLAEQEWAREVRAAWDRFVAAFIVAGLSSAEAAEAADFMVEHRSGRWI